MTVDQSTSGERQLAVGDSSAMETLGAALAPTLFREGAVVALSGELGAGKTTLVRGLLRGLGHQGVVRSPTYTLLEQYDIGQRQVLHLDLYRLTDAQELDYLGLREALSERPLVLVEWPERGAGALPPWDLAINIAYAGRSRRVKLSPASDTGRSAVSASAAAMSPPTRTKTGASR